MQRVATSVIEVRDGTVRNYFGNYESYLHPLNRRSTKANGFDMRQRQARATAGCKAR